MKKQTISLGLKENQLQFFLLVFLNLFVGSIVGLERAVLPIIGEDIFGLASTSAALSFIISFGFTKACVNLFAGALSDRFGRKKILLVGWLFGLFVPVLVIFAPTWWWIIIANIFLGINQGLAWSMTVNMKIDLVKSNQRGLAIGLNEFAGYGGVALATLLSSYIATNYGLRPEPFYIGFVFAVIGLVLSFFVKDTAEHLQLHALHQPKGMKQQISSKEVFNLTTWKDKTLSSASFAGMATNLKDGMAWGLFPVFFLAAGLTIGQTGWIIAIYPAAWGFFQLFTGALSDKIGRKWLIAGGMWLQALAVWFILLVESYSLWVTGAILLGIGTAMVYPTLQAAISDVAPTSWRASSMGIYRFWRDSGYAFGALFAGLLADAFSISWAIGLVACLPFLAGLNVAVRMKEPLK